MKAAQDSKKVVTDPSAPMKRLSWCFAAVILGVGIALVAWEGRFKAEQRFHGTLRDLMPEPTAAGGWSVKYASVADTPEMQRAVTEILNFTEAVYADYTRGPLRISVYLAYWRPGAMHVRAIANHTPDVCWTKAGWNCTRRETIESLPITGGTVRETEHRSFDIHGQTEHVVFWHLAGEEIVSYRTGGRPPWYAAIADFFRWGNQQQQEQFFLRISSNRPLEEFWGSEVVQGLLSRFPMLAN
jgi:hypothetical protein